MSEDLASASTDRDGPRQPRTSGARHWGGFLVSGGLAFATDAGMLALLTRGFGIGPFVARALAIACAMVVGWLGHRRLTFDVPARPSWREFAHYAALQWTSVASNYGLYALLLALWPRLEPLPAMFVSSLVAMAVSYLGMRFGVFRSAEIHPDLKR